MICARCQSEFEPKRRDARYCCDACRQAAYRSRYGSLRIVTDKPTCTPGGRSPVTAPIAPDDADCVLDGRHDTDPTPDGPAVHIERQNARAVTPIRNALAGKRQGAER
jgi:hypothetical protein